MIYAWAKNAPKLVLPEGVAFHVGKSTKLKYLTLQVHYADVTPFKGEVTGQRPVSPGAGTVRGERRGMIPQYSRSML